MKKVLAISLMVLMVICMSLSAYATGEFVQSPSNNKAPVIVDFSCESTDCKSKVVVTPFQDRDNLPEEAKEEAEKAYKDIANSKNVADLCPELSEILEGSNIPETNLSVSDLFNVDHTDCDDHSKHGAFDLTIEADTLKNFVALMYYSADGWKVVEGAKVVMVNGEYHLQFNTDVFGTFAVVVNSSVIAEKNPHTGDSNLIYLYAAVMLASAFVISVTLKKTKKQTV